MNNKNSEFITTTKHFARILNLFNTVPAQPYRELLEDRQEKVLTENYVWNPSNADFGTENFAYFISISKKIN